MLKVEVWSDVACPWCYIGKRRFAEGVRRYREAGGAMEVEVEYRFGWGLPMGFTKVPDPAGWGMAIDPVYVNPVGPLPSEAARDIEAFARDLATRGGGSGLGWA